MLRSPAWLAWCVVASVVCALPVRAEQATFRLNDLDLRDTHFYFNFLGCRDVTDTPLAGFSINGTTQTSIQTDSDANGLLDLSYLLVFEDADPSLPGGNLKLVGGDCTAPLGTTTCMPGAGSVYAMNYVNQAAGICLSTIAGTTHPYAPGISTPAAACFVTEATTLVLTIGGIPMTLRDARIGGTYVGNPPTSIANGLIRGFLTQADADATTIPASYPLVGGQRLSSVLPGGTGCCAVFSDLDTDGPNVGWWVYLNFPGAQVPYSDPNSGVGPSDMPAASLRVAYPNPFDASVAIEYTLPVASAIHLAVFDAQGRHVADLAGGVGSPGAHTARWNGVNDSSAPAGAGVYFVRLDTAGKTITKRLVLAR